MGVGDRLPFNNSRRLRWAATRAASVQICSTLPQSAGGAPNFTGFARRRDPLLRPVAPACARLCPLRPVVPPAPGCARLRPLAPGCAVQCRPAPSCTVPHRRTRPLSRRSPVALQSLRTPAPSHPGPFALLHRHTPALRTPAPAHPGPSRHFFNRCHCFSRRHLPRKPTLIQPYSLRGNRWKSTTGQSLLTRCFFFSSC